MFLAVKLGPYNFGIWGFILLLLTYFDLINLGIPHSITVLLVQHKNEKEKVKNYETTSMFLNGILGLGVVVLAIYYYFFGIASFEKYQTGNLFYIVCLIAIFAYFNNLFSKIYRVKGRIFEIGFFQAIIPVLAFISIFCAKNRELLYVLLIAYLFGQIISIILFIRGKKMSFNGKYNVKDAKTILNKGFFLFVYSSCFYFIVLSTRTIVSMYYSVEQFGYFTFAYTLANAVLLLLEAFSYLITPKLIDKVNSPDIKQVEATIKSLRINYVSLSHLLMYLAMMCFPILLYLIPKYSQTLSVLNLTALTLLLYTNSFGYISLLMARNKEKIIAANSFIVMLINIILALLLVKIFHVKYSFVIIATMFSYLIYSYLLVYSGKKELHQNRNFIAVMKDCFPINLFLPFVVAVIIISMDIQQFIFISGIVFFLLNISTMKEIFQSLKKILKNPNIIDI
jgi:O-antigen/teichoic acid export membrane protein